MSAATVLDGLDAVRAAVGTELGTSDWVSIDAARLATFEEATGAADVGWLLLSLTNLMLPEIIEVRGISAGVNYGTEAVRFPAPLELDARVRASATLTAADEVRGGVQTTITIVVEAEGTADPVCVVESLSRWLA